MGRWSSVRFEVTVEWTRGRAGFQWEGGMTKGVLQAWPLGKAFWSLSAYSILLPADRNASRMRNSARTGFSK